MKEQVRAGGLDSVKYDLPLDVLTLRDHFAAYVIQGLASKHGFVAPWAKDAATTAYIVADAMIEARKNGG